MGKNGRILIVDDEYPKAQAIYRAVESLPDVTVNHVATSRDALEMLKSTSYDLIVIDLQIPEVPGEDVKPFAGRDLLEYIDCHDDLSKPTHILGVTAHEDSYNECIESFRQRGWTLIRENEDPGLLERIVLAKLRHAMDPPDSYDVAIVTALEDVELTQVLKWPCDWIPITERGDCSIVYGGALKTATGREISVVASSCPRMGIADASALCMKLCIKYSPKYVFMTGIAAGIETKTSMGDILVADPCWDWGSGKQTVRDGSPVFLAAPNQIPLDPLMRAKLKRISTTRDHLDDINAGWPESSRPTNELNVHVGPVATGSMVLEDPQMVAMIQSQHRDTLGVEMEAYGVAAAASISSAHPPKVVIMKSVCDFADPMKNDQWQEYAAYTSSQLALRLIENEIDAW